MFSCVHENAIKVFFTFFSQHPMTASILLKPDGIQLFAVSKRLRMFISKYYRRKGKDQNSRNIPVVLRQNLFWPKTRVETCCWKRSRDPNDFLYFLHSSSFSSSFSYPKNSTNVNSNDQQEQHNTGQRPKNSQNIFVREGTEKKRHLVFNQGQSPRIVVYPVMLSFLVKFSIQSKEHV